MWFEPKSGQTRHNAEKKTTQEMQKKSEKWSNMPKSDRR